MLYTSDAYAIQSGASADVVHLSERDLQRMHLHKIGNISLAGSLRSYMVRPAVNCFRRGLFISGDDAVLMAIKGL